MTLHDQIDRVIQEGNCSGCGACLLLDTGLAMQLDEAGFARPTLVAPSTASTDAERLFAQACPGRVVRAVHPRNVERHPTMGPVVAVWEAWATDAQIRFAGSSGGALTALADWIRSTGRATRVVGATAAPDARRSVAISITTREEALAAAGSRYAPVTTDSSTVQPGGATIGLPCRISAMRSLDDSQASEILLSFFCAGTPSQLATDSLAASVGAPGQPASLRYRGNGWPGRFAVQHADGSVASLSYEQSWGEHLGRAVQQRCKLCPDGVGESADVSAADLWDADESGYPRFTDRDGVSALIARTARGYELVVEAAAAGVLELHPIRIERLAAVQPYQDQRRRTLAGRLLGSVLAGRRVPQYRGFGLLALAAGRWRESVRAARGAWSRERQRR